MNSSNSDMTLTGQQCLELLRVFYPEDTPLRRLLLKHSYQVRGKALEILASAPTETASKINADLVSGGALLHDLGIGRCHAPGILCEGKEDYIAHGVIGARLLRELKRPELEPYARICERHTGAGITAEEVREQGLPIPERDYLPETLEEKLVCLADKFFSKSGDQLEKPFKKVRHSLEKFGADSVERFDSYCRLFGVK